MFRVYFNRRKFWINVYLDDVHPATFERRGGGRWGYFVAGGGEGQFGDVHLVASRVRHDVVVHELFHVAAAYMLSHWCLLTPKTEERWASLLDELTRGFWREYEKQVK